MVSKWPEKTSSLVPMFIITVCCARIYSLCFNKDFPQLWCAHLIAMKGIKHKRLTKFSAHGSRNLEQEYGNILLLGAFLTGE